MKSQVPIRFALAATLILSLACPLAAQSPPDSVLVQSPLGQASDAAAVEDPYVGLVGHIGGSALAVAVRGRYAYVGCGPGLHIVDVSNPTAPKMVGKTAPLPGLAEDIALSSDYAYVAAGAGGLWIINISDPAHPTFAGLFATRDFAQKVVAAGDHAYVSVSDYPLGGLQIINISDVAHPVEVAWYDADDAAPRGGGLDTVGHYLYYATRQLRVFDVSDPTHPNLVGSCSASSNLSDVQVVADYAYVADQYGLRVVNISDPTNPTLVGYFKTPDVGRKRGHHVAVGGDYAYLADLEDRLYVLDVWDPSRPIQVGFYSTPGITWDLAAAGGYLYLPKDLARYSNAPYWRGGLLHIINATNPAEPIEAGVYQSWGNARGLSLSGDYAYIADGNGMRAVSIADPSSPSEASFSRTEGVASDVSLEGNYACVADGAQGLRVLNVSDPAHPGEAGFYVTPREAYRVAKAGDHAYVIDYNLGLWIVDLSDPAHPVEVAFHALHSPRDLVVIGHHAYVAGQDEFHIIDVSDPQDPREIGSCYAGFTRRLAVDGDYAYLSVYGNLCGLMIISIADPTHPTLVANYTEWMGRSHHGVAASGNRVFLGVSYGLRVIDVSDPLHPKDVGFYGLPDQAEDVGLRGDNIYVADSLGGLFILRPVPPASIGDCVWHDENADGIQDEEETGLGGVNVRLYDCAGEWLDTTTTVADGSYLFDQLGPGDYYLEFVAPNGYVFSPQDQPGDETRDSDANVVTGRTVCTTLGAGEQDMTWDAALHTALSITKSRPYGDVIASYSFRYDIDVYNLSDAPLNDVVVRDTLPEAIASYSVRVSQGGEFDGVNSATWNMGTLEPRDSTHVWIVASTYSTAARSYLRNAAMVQSAEAPMAYAEDVSWVYPAPLTSTPTATKTPTVTATPTEMPGGDLTISGLVHDAMVGPMQPIEGATVWVLMPVPRNFQTVTDADGRYELLLPGLYVNQCSEVTLGASANGYQSFAEVISIGDLRTQPEREIPLLPEGAPTLTPTPTPTGTVAPPQVAYYLYLPAVKVNLP